MEPDASLRRLELQVGKHTVSYRQTGGGPRFLLVHGFAVGLTTWEEVVPQLSSDFTVILLDLPGYGDNFNVRVATEIGRMSMFLLDFIAAIGGVDYLLGYSYGGRVALEAAKHPPGALRKVIILSVPVFSRGPYRWLAPRVLLLLSKHHGPVMLVRRISAHPWLGKWLFFAAGVADFRGRAIQRCLYLMRQERIDRYAFRQISAIYSPLTGLPTITLPVDLIYGERDRLAKLSTARKMAAKLRRA
ncbi:MAG TPA: alpha/beta hydrolase, partial [Chloroflexia bacterium]